MGMVTVIVINNDYLDSIREMGEFGQIVADSVTLWPYFLGKRVTGGAEMREPLRMRSLGYCVTCEHADAEQYLLIHREDTRPLTSEEIDDVKRGQKKRARKQKESSSAD